LVPARWLAAGITMPSSATAKVIGVWLWGATL
jgi:hypothetical protein